MKVDYGQFLEDGFLILRQAISAKQLESLRTKFEVLVDRQRAIWVDLRTPGDPPGGRWEKAAQPRLGSFEALIDADSAEAVEFCYGDSTMGVCRQITGAADVAVHAFMMMCSPVSDHGPSNWHRDIHPIDQAPLNGLQQDLLSNRPAYLQWNIPLYDDDVLWVVPGSHKRSNTAEENRQLTEDNRVPLPHSLPVELEAGDAVVYTNMILHWGSNYSRKLRRTIHLAYRALGGDNLSYVPGMYYTEGYDQYLQAPMRDLFQRHRQLYLDEVDLIEGVYRALIEKRTEAVFTGIERLHPGEEGRIVSAILLSKLAYKLKSGGRHPYRERFGGDYTQQNELAPRFSKEELEILWARFEPLDEKLQGAGEQFVPGFQSGPMPYLFERMPADLDLDWFFDSWKDQ